MSRLIGRTLVPAFVLSDPDEAITASNQGEPIYTIVCSPDDGSLWFSRALWRDATFAWIDQIRPGWGERPREHSFHRLTPDIRALFPARELDTMTPGENAVFIQHVTPAALPVRLLTEAQQASGPSKETSDA